MKNNNSKKYIKIGLSVLLITFISAAIYTFISAESTPSSDLPEDADSIDMYDDMEFYNMTHNEDGSMNEYGKSLL